MSYFDNCFDHITDPVQRNSVRQQWLQMVGGGLSAADVRILLEKYPDFRVAISQWISATPESLGFSYDTMDRLKEFVATLPEFKDVFDKYVSELVSWEWDPLSSKRDDLRQEIKKLATIFPQFKQVAEQRIEHTESLMRLREEYQREIQQEIEREMFTEKSPNYFSSLKIFQEVVGFPCVNPTYESLFSEQLTVNRGNILPPFN